MILDIDRGFCFVHLPRTAGVAISEVIAASCPGAVVRLHAGRHRWAWQIAQDARDLTGDAEAWGRLRCFGVVRSPWEVIESDYRLTRDHAVLLSTPAAAPWLDGWRDRVRRLAADGLDFGRFVRREYLGHFSGVLLGGFWRTWCCSAEGADLGVRPIPFDRLAAAWPEICRWAGIPPCQLARLNASKPAPTPWTADLVAAVGNLCRMDVERFRFEPPAIKIAG